MSERQSLCLVKFDIFLLLFDRFYYSFSPAFEGKLKKMLSNAIFFFLLYPAPFDVLLFNQVAPPGYRSVCLGSRRTTNQPTVTFFSLRRGLVNLFGSFHRGAAALFVTDESVSFLLAPPLAHSPCLLSTLTCGSRLAKALVRVRV